MIPSVTRAAMLAASCIFLATSAQAASLVSARVLEVEVDPKAVEAERKAAWEKLGAWCAIKDWHPAVTECKEYKEGEDVFRDLTLTDGAVIKERRLEQDAMSYKYEIISGPLPVKNYSAQFSVTPDDDDLDEYNVAWSATYDPEGKPAKEARKTIDGIFKDGLSSIDKMLNK